MYNLNITLKVLFNRPLFSAILGVLYFWFLNYVEKERWKFTLPTKKSWIFKTPIKTPQNWLKGLFLDAIVTFVKVITVLKFFTFWIALLIFFSYIFYVNMPLFFSHCHTSIEFNIIRERQMFIICKNVFSQYIRL